MSDITLAIGVDASDAVASVGTLADALDQVSSAGARLLAQAQAVGQGLGQAFKTGGTGDVAALADGVDRAGHAVDELGDHFTRATVTITAALGAQTAAVQENLAALQAQAAVAGQLGTAQSPPSAREGLQRVTAAKAGVQERLALERQLGAQRSQRAAAASGPSGYDVGRGEDATQRIEAQAAATKRLADAWASGTVAAIKQAQIQQQIDVASVGKDPALLDRLTAAYKALNDQRTRLDLAKEAADTGAETQALNELAAAYAKGDDAVAQAKIVYDAEREAHQKLIDPIKDQAEWLQILADKTNQATNAATALGNTIDDQQNKQLKDAQFQSSTLGMGQDQAAIAKAQYAVAAQYGDKHSLVGADRLQHEKDTAAAIVQQNQAYAAQKASLDELTGFADQMFERIGSAITEAFTQGKGAAVSFRSIAKGVLSEVEQETIKLAVINPLKNWLAGTNANPTLGSVLSVYGGPVGGMAAPTGSTGLNGGGGSAGAGSSNPFGMFQSSGGTFSQWIDQQGLSVGIGSVDSSPQSILNADLGGGSVANLPVTGGLSTYLPGAGMVLGGAGQLAAGNDVGGAAGLVGGGMSLLGAAMPELSIAGMGLGPIGMGIGLVGGMLGGLLGGGATPAGPNGDARIDFSGGKFGLGASGGDNGFDPSQLKGQASQLAETLNSLVATNGLSVNAADIPAGLGLASGSKAGDSAMSADQVIDKLVGSGAFSGSGAVGTSLSYLQNQSQNGNAVGLSQLQAAMQFAAALETATKAAGNFGTGLDGVTKAAQNAADAQNASIKKQWTDAQSYGVGAQWQSTEQASLQNQITSLTDTTPTTALGKALAELNGKIQGVVDNAGAAQVSVDNAAIPGQVGAWLQSQIQSQLGGTAGVQGQIDAIWTEHSKSVGALNNAGMSTASADQLFTQELTKLLTSLGPVLAQEVVSAAPAGSDLAKTWAGMAQGPSSYDIRAQQATATLTGLSAGSQSPDAVAAQQSLAALQRQAQQAQELNAATDAATRALILHTQALENEAAAASDARQMTEALAAQTQLWSSLHERVLAATNQTQTGQTNQQYQTLALQQQKEMQDAINAGESQALLDQLALVQQLETAAVALNQARGYYLDSLNQEKSAVTSAKDAWYNLSVSIGDFLTSLNTQYSRESSVEIHCSLTRFGSRNAHKKALVAT